MQKTEFSTGSKIVRNETIFLFSEADNKIALTSINDHSYFGLDIISKSNDYSS